MTRQGWIATLVLVTGLSALGVGWLTADEPVIPRQQRISPQLLKEALAERPVISAASTHSVGRTLQDLRALAADLDKGGHKSEASRLNAAIREIVRRAEHELAEKKSQISSLNADVEELKWAAGQ